MLPTCSLSLTSSLFSFSLSSFLFLLSLLIFLFCGGVPAVIKSTGINQDSGIKTAKVGDSVTLQCSCKGSAVTFLYWYQQTLGHKPQVISILMKGNTEAEIHHEPLRFSVQSGQGTNNLTIKNLSLSDSATYYCATSEFNAAEFGQGAFLHVKTSLSKDQAVVQHPPFERVQPGNSVNLSCTIYAEPCGGEHSIYWYRQGGSQPGIVYTQVDQCKELSQADSPRQSCSFNLLMKNLSSSDVGTYYCALASCGQIVFGNGTQLDIVADETTVPVLLAQCLGGALAVSLILMFVLGYIVYRLNRKSCSVCNGLTAALTCAIHHGTIWLTPLFPCSSQGQDRDQLHYAALSLNGRNRPRRQRDSMDTVCVYSGIRQ
uniref:Ig-like domain-containing protein n=1 Tax=Myripristis murdjan TaxID=586833 RepID=A0A667YZS4_9TELE